MPATLSAALMIWRRNFFSFIFRSLPRNAMPLVWCADVGYLRFSFITAASLSKSHAISWYIRIIMSALSFDDFACWDSYVDLPYLYWYYFFSVSDMPSIISHCSYRAHVILLSTAPISSIWCLAPFTWAYAYFARHCVILPTPDTLYSHFIALRASLPVCYSHISKLFMISIWSCGAHYIYSQNASCRFCGHFASTHANTFFDAFDAAEMPDATLMGLFGCI